MKDKNAAVFYLLIIVLSLFPLINIFQAEKLFHSHDGLVHLPRIAAYFKALQDGQFPVRFAGDLNYGYGLPLFNFIYPLPYLISSFFLFLGFGLVNSFKVSISLSFILSGIFMYLFAKELFEDKMKAFFVTIFYQFSFFRLVELLVRGSFGEVYTYTFLPLALFGLTKILKKESKFFSFWFLITSISSTLLIISHNSVSFIFFGAIVLYLILFSETMRNFVKGLAALSFGILASSFYWLPAIVEHKYTYGDLFMEKLYTSHFTPFVYLFIPNFFNSPTFQTGGVSTQIGFFHVVAILLAIYALFRKKMTSRVKKIFIFCLILIVGSFFFMEKTSLIFWENLPMLRQFQFPWRFLSVIVFATSLLSISFFTVFKFSKKTYLLIAIIVVLSTIYFWKPSLGYDKIDERYYWNFPLNTTYYGETDVIWSAGPAKSYPKQRIEVISGKAEIKNFSKKSNLHTFQVTAKTNVTLVDHTQYFPGWKAYVDGKPTEIEFQDINHKGEIEFRVPKGEHSVKTVFAETKLRLMANLLSIFSLVIVIIIVIAPYSPKKFFGK